MRALILGVVLLSGAAFAQHHCGGGFRGGGGFNRGGGFSHGGGFNRGNGFHSGGWGGGFRTPFVPRVYVVPQVRSYPRPQYYVPPPIYPVAPVGGALSVLPQGATVQVINGQTYAVLGSNWFLWDASTGAWVVVQAP